MLWQCAAWLGGRSSGKNRFPWKESSRFHWKKSTPIAMSRGKNPEDSREKSAASVISLVKTLYWTYSKRSGSCAKIVRPNAHVRPRHNYCGNGSCAFVAKAFDAQDCNHLKQQRSRFNVEAQLLTVQRYNSRSSCASGSQMQSEFIAFRAKQKQDACCRFASVIDFTLYARYKIANNTIYCKCSFLKHCKFTVFYYRRYAKTL